MTEPAPVWALVVDDSAAVRLWVRRALEVAGVPAANILAVADGASAIARVRRDRPKLVILDVNMPIMNGLEALSLIRQDPKLRGTRVVVLSSDADETRSAVARAYGAVVLLKPVPAEAVVGVARDVFGARLRPPAAPEVPGEL